MKYNLDLVGGHMIVPTAEGSFLVDTGSPASFSRTGRVAFGGSTVPAPQSAMGMMDADALSALAGIAVDGLLGMDILGQHSVVFDDDELFVDESPIPDAEFHVAGTDCFMGIPVASFHVNRHSLRVFVDTGAKISYLDGNLLAGRPIEETMQDFYPGLGRFEVSVSTIVGEIAGKPLTARFGRLPPLLQTSLMIGGVNGILGRDLFARFAVRLENGGGSVSVALRKEDASARVSVSSGHSHGRGVAADNIGAGPVVHLETGDIFDSLKRNGVQGVAFIVPLGLTAFRVLASDFLKTNGSLLSADGTMRVFVADSRENASLVRIVEVQTSRFAPFSKEDVDHLIERIFAVFEAAGCTVVGLNGIKIVEEDRSGNQFLSEQTTLDAVRNWGKRHPDSSIRDVYLVDKRGGFEHVLE